MKKVLLIILALSIALSCAVGFAACKRNKDDEGVITIRNLYFNDWNGEDDYTAMLEEKFDTKFKVSSYSWADWSTQVSSSWQSNSLPNVFQDDIDSYNFANTYLAYVDDGAVKVELNLSGENMRKGVEDLMGKVLGKIRENGLQDTVKVGVTFGHTGEDPMVKVAGKAVEADAEKVLAAIKAAK